MKTDKWRVRRSLNSEPVKSAGVDFVADIPLASFDLSPSVLALSSSFSPFSSFSSSTLSFSLFLYLSFHEAAREPIFPRNVRISQLGRNREGNSIGALFYKYLSSFESIGD